MHFINSLEAISKTDVVKVRGCSEVMENRAQLP